MDQAIIAAVTAAITTLAVHGIQAWRYRYRPINLKTLEAFRGSLGVAMGTGPAGREGGTSPCRARLHHQPHGDCDGTPETPHPYLYGGSSNNCAVCGAPPGAGVHDPGKGRA